MENTVSPSWNVQDAIHRALRTIDQNLISFSDRYPCETTTNNIYHPLKAHFIYPEGSNFGWTTSFLPGMIWLAYELTLDKKYRLAAEAHIPSFVQRIDQKIDVDTHDLGFLYSLSCVAAWRLTGNEMARQAAIRAARHLLTRYLEKAGIIQAWGDLNDPRQRGRAIIDSLLNMPLLYWAANQTGDKSYQRAAYTHAIRLRDNIFRPDNSTYHTFFFDPETGAALRGNTAQGYADDSCWARGQAWGIYGFIVNYRYSKDETFLRAAEKCADYFLAHLPADRVAYWDLIFTDGSSEERDSSAAAIAVCGLQEIIRWLPDGERRSRYQSAVDAILAVLVKNYANFSDCESNALLLHGVYSKPAGMGVNEGNLWGDYFYLEALTRIAKPDWAPYW